MSKGLKAIGGGKVKTYRLVCSKHVQRIRPARNRPAWIGGAQPAPVDIRLIAATNRDLDSAVARCEFRRDLYYRLKVLSVKTPPLRERPEDIPVLARYFVDKYSHETGRTVRGISPEAESILQNYDWPGNVRQLENAIQHAIVLGSTEAVLEQDLPRDLVENAQRWSEGVDCRT